MARKSALVIAEAANPDWVSVPLVGWSMARALSDVADIHLVTQIRNQSAIEATGWREGQEFTAIDTERLAAPMHKLASVLRMGSGKGWTMQTAIQSLVYPYFERLTWQRFGADIKAGKYDVVHRVTPLTPTTTSPMAAKCAAAGVPFVIGPLNGGVPWPRGFDAERRREREWLSYVRSAYKLAPGRGAMFRATSAVIVGSRHTGTEVPAAHQDKTIYIPENAIDPARFNKVAPQDVSGPLRGCFIGRLVPYKGPDMLLEGAAPLMQQGRLVLDIIGDGPMMPDLKAQAERLGVAQSVNFHGQLPHNQVQDVASAANLLTFPSIREFGGGVVLEAMALGVVPVVMDYAGPGELVTPETGFAIPMGPKDQIISSLSALLDQIAQDPNALPGMGQAARARATQMFTWEAKAAQIAQVYDWVLAPEGPRPEFF